MRRRSVHWCMISKDSKGDHFNVSREKHLDFGVEVEHKIGHVVGVVHGGDAANYQSMVHHASILDEASFGSKLL